MIDSFLLTEINDSDSVSILPDDERADDRFDEVKNQLPVVDSSTLVVTNTGRVIDQERDVSDTYCNQTNSLFDAHCCTMGTAIKHPVPDRVKPSFVIFDIRAL